MSKLAVCLNHQSGPSYDIHNPHGVDKAHSGEKRGCVGARYRNITIAPILISSSSLIVLFVGRTSQYHCFLTTKRSLTNILTNSKRLSNMATQRVSLIEKLTLIPHLAIGLSLGLLRLTTRPFNNDSKPPTAYKDFIYTLARYMLSNVSIAHEKWLNPSSESAYLSFASEKGFQPDTAILPSGLKVHWVGNKGAEKVFLYFHGGGYVNPMSPAHLEWLYELQADLSKTKSIAVAAVGYTCSPEGQYPLQLKQAAESLIWLLQTEGKKPEDVRLATMELE